MRLFVFWTGTGVYGDAMDRLFVQCWEMGWCCVMGQVFDYVWVVGYSYMVRHAAGLSESYDMLESMIYGFSLLATVSTRV